MRLLIDQISMHQENDVVLEEKVKRKEHECEQLRTVVQDLERTKQEQISIKAYMMQHNAQSKKGVRSLILEAQVPVAAVVIMACNRADYLERTIQSILRYHSSVALKFPLFVSQDGSNSDVRTKAMGFDQLTYMQPKSQISGAGYDMVISPDFFDYFEAGADLLDKDKSIMAISSWNDNGQKQFVNDPYALYRSDFFPGLGWMLSKPTWDELSPKWPKAYPFWRGSSLGQFFPQYLKPIKLNDIQVDWKSMDLSYLMEDKFVKHFADLVRSAKPLNGTDLLLKTNNVDGDVRIQYRDQSHFENIAQQYGIFDEWKDGIPRTAYKGVVVFRHQTLKRVFLVGPDSLQQLGIQNA
ncbi:hypothetical protein L6452_17648 [Arctium lappa]|uniref:Uncharacterized protein n=1 Tax=Arctium lappa TaxID=4217 RepID=A0ACB9C3U8_ARCLA|nr:hypothetical protein L6452_17648 [Arctium lappa]